MMPSKGSRMINPGVTSEARKSRVPSVPGFGTTRMSQERTQGGRVKGETPPQAQTCCEWAQQALSKIVAKHHRDLRIHPSPRP